MLKSIIFKIVFLSFLVYGNVVYSANLVTNGDFEAGSGGWLEWNSPGSWVSGVFDHDYVSGCTIWAPQNYPLAGIGTHCQHVGADRVHGGFYQVISVVEGRKYTVSGKWSGGGGGLSSDAPNTYAAWFEVVIFHGAVGAAEIDSGQGETDVIAKKEFSGNGDENFNFDWELFSATFTAQTSKVTLAFKTGQYGFSWDAIASYHDNIEMKPVTSWPIFVPAMTRPANK